MICNMQEGSKERCTPVHTLQSLSGFAAGSDCVCCRHRNCCSHQCMYISHITTYKFTFHYVYVYSGCAPQWLQYYTIYFCVSSVGCWQRALYYTCWLSEHSALALKSGTTSFFWDGVCYKFCISRLPDLDVSFWCRSPHSNSCCVHRNKIRVLRHILFVSYWPSNLQKVTSSLYTTFWCVSPSSCWLSQEKGVIWSFIAPMLAVILVRFPWLQHNCLYIQYSFGTCFE